MGASGEESNERVCDGPPAERPSEIYERITDGFYALDEEWRFTYVNERAEDIIQRSEAEVLGASIWEEFPEAADGVVWEKYHQAMETQEPVDFDLYYEPLDVWVEVNAYPSETGLSVYLLDISERVEREQELSRYRRIVETINDGVYAVDPDGRFTMVNAAYAEMLGYEREELVGEHVSKVVSDDIAEAARELEAAQVAGEREAPSLEAELHTADGETIVAEATFALLSNGNGEYERIGVVRDVTERKRYEERLNETVEELAESNERLDRFASMLAHELRNPLNIAEIYLKQIETDDATAIEQVADALDRMEAMLDVLLVLAKERDAISRGQTVALADVARDAWGTLETESASLVSETSRAVRGDESHLRHLFENLFRNSVEHGSTDGRPRTDDADGSRETGVTVRVGDLEGGFYVEDDGPGIAEDERDEVFEAGYSTEEGGLGLGLTFVARLADAYGWTCAVTESDDGGARFEFTDVPLADEE